MHPRMMRCPLTCVKETFPFEHTAEIQNNRAGWPHGRSTAGLDQLMVSMLDARRAGDEGSAADSG